MTRRSVLAILVLALVLFPAHLVDAAGPPPPRPRSPPPKAKPQPLPKRPPPKRPPPKRPTFAAAPIPESPYSLAWGQVVSAGNSLLGVLPSGLLPHSVQGVLDLVRAGSNAGSSLPGVLDRVVDVASVFRWLGNKVSAIEWLLEQETDGGWWEIPYGGITLGQVASDALTLARPVVRKWITTASGSAWADWLYTKHGADAGYWVNLVEPSDMWKYLDSKVLGAGDTASKVKRLTEVLGNTPIFLTGQAAAGKTLSWEQLLTDLKDTALVAADTLLDESNKALFDLREAGLFNDKDRDIILKGKDAVVNAWQWLINDGGIEQLAYNAAFAVGLVPNAANLLGGLVRAVLGVQDIAAVVSQVVERVSQLVSLATSRNTHYQGVWDPRRQQVIWSDGGVSELDTPEEKAFKLLRDVFELVQPALFDFFSTPTGSTLSDFLITNYQVDMVSLLGDGRGVEVVLFSILYDVTYGIEYNDASVFDLLGEATTYVVKEVLKGYLKPTDVLVNVLQLVANALGNILSNGEPALNRAREYLLGDSGVSVYQRARDSLLGLLGLEGAVETFSEVVEPAWHAVLMVVTRAYNLLSSTGLLGLIVDDNHDGY